MVAIAFYVVEENSMAVNGYRQLTHTIQNIFFCVQQKNNS